MHTFRLGIEDAMIIINVPPPSILPPSAAIQDPSLRYFTPDATKIADAVRVGQPATFTATNGGRRSRGNRGGSCSVVSPCNGPVLALSKQVESLLPHLQIDILLPGPAPSSLSSPTAIRNGCGTTFCTVPRRLSASFGVIENLLQSV